MNGEKASPRPTQVQSRSLIIALATISTVSGLLVVLAFQLTLPRITLNKQRALERAVFTVLSDATVRKNYYLDTEGLSLLPDDSFARANVYAGYNDRGTLAGMAIEGSARGYQDVVKVLYGYSLESQSIVGMTVLQSSETPGLGDKVESDPEFLANFIKLDARLNEASSALENPIVTVKRGKKIHPWQIDGISGATITSTTIGTALRESADHMLPLLVQYESSLERTIPTPKGNE